jgi:D-sedoheptulose 7-phosphate isomerase
MSFAARYIERWLEVSAALDPSSIDRAVDVLANARDRDATVWTAGNGGGNALASHLATGLTLNTRRAGGRPFRAMCLGADAVAVSAATNDFGAEEALRTILECNGQSGDVLCVFSVSGESANIIRAVLGAKHMNIEVIALVGDLSSTTAQAADHPIFLGSIEPGIAEDVASAVMHSMYCTFMYDSAATLPSGSADVD